MKSELRRSALERLWVLVHPEEKIPKGNACPFDEGNETLTPPEIIALRNYGNPNQSGWRVRVVPNHNPLFGVITPMKGGGGGILYDFINNCGCNEIIVESPRHQDNWLDMQDEKILEILNVIRQRVKDLKRCELIRCLTVYKEFRKPDDKIDHSYSTIVGLPVIPPYFRTRLKDAKDYYNKKDRCILCDIVTEELKNTERIVIETGNLLAFIPYAALKLNKTYSEVMILPKSRPHQLYWEESEVAFSLEFVWLIKNVLVKLHKFLGENKDITYLMRFHSLNIEKDRRRGYWQTLKDDFHWYIELIPRTQEESGFEIATGIPINPIYPEDAAKILREA